MNTQPNPRGSLSEGALKNPGAAANDGSRQQLRGDQDDPPLTETITQLPGVQLVYRALKSWQEELTPRHYGHATLSMEQSAKQSAD